MGTSSEAISTRYSRPMATIAQPSVEQVVAAIRQLEFEDVQVIIDEWEQLGREEFLRLHSLSSAFKYLLVWGDKTYDAKAVAVQAVRTKHPELVHLRSNAFDGDASTIAKPLRTAGWEVVDKRDIDRGIEEEQHDRELQDRANIGPAEKSQLRTARIGQGKFKHNVLLRESKCRITGISDPLHLRASHIKPWCKSNDSEKLDGNNGLMLAPHIDHLFDRGWITFQENGDVLLSPQCALVIFHAFGIVPNMNVGSFTAEQDAYLEYHRDSLFKK